MIEAQVEIVTDDGVMSADVFHPEGEGSWPPVILYMDASGIREELRNMSRRIATQGYLVLLPDIYYRLGNIRFDPERRDENRDESMMKVVTAARLSLNNARIMVDTRGMLDFLDTHTRAKAGPRGCVGYCMSGQYVVSAVGTFPDQILAGASLYGVGIVTDQPDSPHLLADRMKGELYLGFAEVDHLVPDNVVPDLKAALEKNGVAYACKTFPGTRHGFCFEERSLYVKEAAEEVWEKMFDLFRRRLS